MNWLTAHLLYGTILVSVTGFSCLASPIQLSFDTSIEQLKSMDWGQDQKSMEIIDAEIQNAGENHELRQQIERKLISVLQSDSTFFAKQYVCRKLANIASSQSIDALSMLLTDEKLSHMARYALEKIPDPVVDTVFRNALEKSDGQIKIGIIHSLGSRRSGEEKLLALLDSSDPEIVLAAVSALGRVGGPQAGMAILSRLDTQVDTAYLIYADALLAIAHNAVMEGQTQLSVSLYEKLYKDGKKEHIQVAGFMGLLDTQPKRIERLLQDAMESSNPLFNRLAGRYLTETKNVELFDYYIKNFDSIPMAGQLAVLSAIQARDYKSAHAVVVDTLRNDSTVVRTAAIDCLAAIGREADIHVLVKIAAETKGLEKQAAQRALCQLDGEGVDVVMISMLKDSDSAVQVELIKAMSFRKTAVACDAVIDRIDDSNETVSTAALQIIAELGNVSHVPPVLSVMEKTDRRQIQRTCEQTLLKLCSRYPDDILPLILKRAKTAHGQVCYALLRIAASTNCKEVLEVVLTTLAEENSDSKSAAINILSNWKDTVSLSESSAFSDLYAVAKNDPEVKIRIIALRGYISLIQRVQMSPEDKQKMLSEAMAIVERKEEKVLAISALSSVKSPNAMEQILAVLENDEIQMEARIAVLKIVELLQHDYPDTCINALRVILVNDGSDSVTENAKLLLERLELYKGQLLYECGFEENGCGWIAEKDIEMTVSNGELVLKTAGEDPIISNRLDLPGGELEVCLEVQAGPTSVWQIFWGSATKELATPPIWLVNFQVPYTDGQWQEVKVPIKVEGNLTTLRIDPGQGQDVIRISSIRVLRSEKAAAEMQGRVYDASAQTPVLLIGAPLGHSFGTYMYVKGCELLKKCFKKSRVLMQLYLTAGRDIPNQVLCLYLHRRVWCW